MCVRSHASVKSERKTGDEESQRRIVPSLFVRWARQISEAGSGVPSNSQTTKPLQPHLSHSRSVRQLRLSLRPDPAPLLGPPPRPLLLLPLRRRVARRGRGRGQGGRGRRGGVVGMIGFVPVGRLFEAADDVSVVDADLDGGRVRDGGGVVD